MEEILRKLNSIKLTLMAHPDYAMTDGGEFHDQVESIEEIETELKNIAVLDGVVGQSEQLVCDVCGSTDVIETPQMGKNCNRCHPL